MLYASSPTLAGIGKLLVDRWYWSKATFVQVGKNTWHIYNAKGLTGFKVIKKGKRYRLESKD